MVFKRTKPKEPKPLVQETLTGLPPMARKDVKFEDVLFLGHTPKKGYQPGAKYDIAVQATQNLIGVWIVGPQPFYHSYKTLAEFEQNWALRFDFQLSTFIPNGFTE